MKQTLGLAKLMNCVAARRAQATPGQNWDEMAKHHRPGHSAFHQLLEGGHPNNDVSPLLNVYDGYLHHHCISSSK